MVAASQTDTAAPKQIRRHAQAPGMNPSLLPLHRSLVMTQATSNPRFAAAVGAPIQAGPWYNSSVAISHDGHIATVTMQLQGSQRSSDVTVRVSGGRWSCVRCRIGPVCLFSNVNVLVTVLCAVDEDMLILPGC